MEYLRAYKLYLSFRVLIKKAWMQKRWEKFLSVILTFKIKCLGLRGCWWRNADIFFLPKFHCKLNPIERVWAQAKRYFKAYCNNSFVSLRKIVVPGLKYIGSVEEHPKAFYEDKQWPTICMCIYSICNSPCVFATFLSFFFITWNENTNCNQ